MAGRKGKPVFRRRPDELPPLSEGLNSLKGTRTRYMVLQKNVGDQCTAANGTEDANTGTTKTREEHQNDSQKEKQKVSSSWKENSMMAFSISAKWEVELREAGTQAELRLLGICELRE